MGLGGHLPGASTALILEGAEVAVGAPLMLKNR